jgi:hypothetical protein
MQTYHDLSKLPSKIQQQFSDLAPDFPRQLFDDDSAIQYIQKHFGEEWVLLFRGFKKGAHKADLFRYCYLYIQGGIYLDIKTQLVVPLSTIYDDLDRAGSCMATCFSDAHLFAPYSWFSYNVYQGIIFAKARNPIFLECMAYMKKYAWRANFQYLTFCKNFADRLKQRGVIKPGITSGWTMWLETISVFSDDCNQQRNAKIPLCSTIVDSNMRKLFITRFHDFPF